MSIKRNRQNSFLHKYKGHHIRVVINTAKNDATPLLVCNGFGLSLDSLDSAVSPLAHQTLIRFDAPGLGGSSKQLSYRFSFLTGFLVHLLDELGYEQVDIYGLSWGGMLAQAFALSYPEYCRKLILAGTYSGFAGIPGNIAWRVLNQPLRWLKGGSHSRIASLFYGGEVDQSHWRMIRGEVKDFFQHCHGYLGQLTAVCGWTSFHRLHTIKAPTLLLYGEQDALIPLINGQMLEKMIPNAHLVTVDCGHLFPWTRTSRVCREINRFRS